MALTVVDGVMGSGKSFYVVNGILIDTLVNSNRPVAVTRNMEVKLENLVRECARRKSRKILRSEATFKAYREEILNRITFLDNQDKQVIDQDSGRPLLVRGSGTEREFRVQTDEDENAIVTDWSPHIANQMAEFWYFTEPNSVIIYDEAADRLNARKFRENMATKLQSYINHSRHYKDDLYFIAQSVDDLDKQLREKFHYVFNVRNSLKSPMCESKRGIWPVLFGGMRWPVQFFIIEKYVREGRRVNHFMTQRIWPTKTGFGCYNSFSAPAEMAGKSLGDGEGESEDYGQSIWKRLAPWFDRLPIILGLIGVACAVGFGVHGLTTGKWQRMLTEGVAKSATAAVKSGDEIPHMDLAALEKEKPLIQDESEINSKPLIQDESRINSKPENEAEENEQEQESEPEPEREKVHTITNRYVFTNRASYKIQAVPDDLRVDVLQFLGVLGGEFRDKVRFINRGGSVFVDR